MKISKQRHINPCCNAISLYCQTGLRWWWNHNYDANEGHPWSDKPYFWYWLCQSSEYVIEFHPPWNYHCQEKPSATDAFYIDYIVVYWRWDPNTLHTNLRESITWNSFLGLASPSSNTMLNLDNHGILCLMHFYFNLS